MKLLNFVLIISLGLLYSCSKEDLEARAKNALDGSPNNGQNSQSQTTDTAPVANTLSLTNGSEDTEKIITLSYTDADSDQADACTISNLSNITETTACSCSGGTCTVGVTGTSGYFGSAGFDYTVSANSKTSNTISVSYTIDVVNISCPTGFVPVLGNGVLGTVDFCVMKYEAKCDGVGACNASDTTSVPESVAAGNPWVSIRADESAAAGSGAQARCEAMSEAGFNTGTFTLISNAEWMTIARDIENTDSNWSGGTVGSGHINRGWTANSGDDGFQNTAVAPSTDTSCLYNTAADTCAATGLHKFKRTHSLSNGSELWDFSGNVYSWVDWDKDTAGFNLGPTDGDTGGWNELNDLVGSLTADDVSPDGAYTSAQNMGRLFSWTSGGAALRGGHWLHGSFAGAFTLYLSYAPSDSHTSIGFRCSYRP